MLTGKKKATRSLYIYNRIQVPFFFPDKKTQYICQYISNMSNI